MKYLISIIIIFTTSLGAKEKVSILISSNLPVYLKGLSGLQYSINAENEVTFLDSIKNDEIQLKNYFTEVESKKPGFIIAIGNEAARLARENLSTTPILFLLANNAKFLSPEKGRLCGFEPNFQLKEYFYTLREIKPEAKRIYTFYISESGEHLARGGDYHDLQSGVVLVRKKLASREEFKDALENIKGKADAYLILSDLLYDKENFELLSTFSKNNEIILISEIPALVELGSVFGLSPDYVFLGVEAGKLANQILEQKLKCDIGPVITPTEPLLLFNEEYSKTANVVLSEKVKSRIRRDQLMSLGVELFYKNAFKTAKNIFSSILSGDPGNEKAIYYQRLCISRLNQGEIDNLEKQAIAFKSKRDFIKASAVYKKILNLDQTRKDAEEEFENCIREASEDKRKQAVSLSNNDPFSSIRAYQESLTILPSNQKSKEELGRLRAKESSRMQEYIKEGLKFYNDRKYAESEKIFANILLVLPENKQVEEYLRLSRLKSEAYIRLKNCSANCRLIGKK